MSAEFKDHFSDRAASYATYRPHYPPALADYLASIAPARGTAWDVGCGSGQMSTLLADRFERVIATDASAEQIVRAAPHPRIAYLIGTAEQAPVVAHSVDLIAVAQAAHWFDLPRFYMEARRVARPDAAIALITYATTIVEPPINDIVHHFYTDVVGKWWPPERKSTETMYRDFEFPFDELRPPAIDMSVEWTADQLIGYISTWSAVRAIEKAEGGAAMATLAKEIRAAWGEKPTRKVWWPVGIRAGLVRAEV
jgi:SAM-dependent methyltransferase